MKNAKFKYQNGKFWNPAWRDTFLLSPVSNEAHLPSALDFASDVALVFGAAARFFTRENFVLPAQKLTQHLAVAQGGETDVGAAKNTDGVTLLFHRLKRDIFNTNIFLLRSASWRSYGGQVLGYCRHGGLGLR